VSGRDPVPAPLDRIDRARARALKARVRDRIGNARRHVGALRVAMAEFGEDFDLEPFRVAFAAEDPAALNRVKALERGAEQLSNCISELAACGLELAGVRGRGDPADTRGDLDQLRAAGVLSRELTRRLQRLCELRRMLGREDATATAERVHESVRLLADSFTPFLAAYGGWVKAGFRTAP
jgi:hypothetical protein